MIPSNLAKILIFLKKMNLFPSLKSRLLERYILKLVKQNLEIFFGMYLDILCEFLSYKQASNLEPKDNNTTQDNTIRLFCKPNFLLYNPIASALLQCSFSILTAFIFQNHIQWSLLLPFFLPSVYPIHLSRESFSFEQGNQGKKTNNCSADSQDPKNTSGFQIYPIVIFSSFLFFSKCNFQYFLCNFHYNFLLLFICKAYNIQEAFPLSIHHQEPPHTPRDGCQVQFQEKDGFPPSFGQAGKPSSWAWSNVR